MPQDLMHFKIAELTARRLADTRFAPCLAGHRSALLLGAVFHDALFYALRRGAEPLEALAHRFHCMDGEDPLDLLRMQARHAASAKDRPQAAAVLAGLAAHLFADAVLHPLVWHFTGDYYDPEPKARTLARQRHRAMEGLMDRAACPGMLGAPAYRIGRLLAECPAIAGDAVPVAGLAELARMTEADAAVALRAAWVLFGRIQRACAMRPLARAFHLLRPVLPDPAREFEALFHAPQRLGQAGFLQGEIAYAHPVTGERAALTLTDAMDRAAGLAANCCRELEGAVFDGAEPAAAAPAPSMETGLPGVPTSRMTHFAAPPFPDLS
ncbi:zinc dependent phospholipase C family protein [Pseudodesulfovibrio sp.]|uniref:zinc dependent phospholipase C family protein n=1 Tax=Pseudodesulfovibrio sp. TaxID=2035812 RepID=UPI00262B0528|nr:zinc dependent phospholipase C family protein [Pseudodesulfovibrio sp.]MDD3313256.1 zinc dependent phospholipase C family protein [Pseudodesulfovibrio sp.]